MNANGYYILSPAYFIIRDAEPNRERLLFHLKTGDYFAVLATALGFIEEALVDNKANTIPRAELALLRDMRKDLLFLNTRYEIHEKTQSAH